MTTIADEMLARVHCYGVGLWLSSLFGSFGQILPDVDASPGTLRPTRLTSALTLTLGRVAMPQTDLRNALVLVRVEGDATAPMPLGLDPAIETPASARVKLTTNTAGGSVDDIARGDRRVSHFLAGGRIVELRFNVGMMGFDRIILARLGAALDWHDPASR